MHLATLKNLVLPRLPWNLIFSFSICIPICICLSVCKSWIQRWQRLRKESFNLGNTKRLLLWHVIWLKKIIWGHSLLNVRNWLLCELYTSVVAAKKDRRRSCQDFLIFLNAKKILLALEVCITHFYIDYFQIGHFTEVSQAWSCLMQRDQNKNVTNYLVSWNQNNEFFISNLNLMLILADHIFKQNEAMWLTELIISAIYDQLMKLKFLSYLILRPIK